MRRWIITLLGAGLALAGSSPAGAATTFYIRGGGDGHGIGMSQYGAYGYALHGKDYRWILGHYYQGTAIGHTDPRQVVRVLIATGRATFTGAGAAAGKKLDPSASYRVRVLGGGDLGVYDATGKKVASGPAPLRVTGPKLLQLNGHGYHGWLEFRSSGGSVQSVNAVDLEDYVRGVISAEMPASWSAQALQAQAVAARTYAITTGVGRNGYQLYSDTRSQMYTGVAAETSATDAAEAATRGQIVTYAGQPVVTYFFASSGGHTENVENVWLGSTPQPWLRGVSDPYDGVAGNPDHRWTIQMSLTRAASRLGSLVRGKLIGIRVTQWGVSPRVVAAQVVGSRGKAEVTGTQLEQAFGLMSTYMSFADISSSAPAPSTGGSLPAPGSTTGGSRLPTHSVLAVAAAGFEALPAPPPLITGTVYPAAGGDRLVVQERLDGRWRTVARTRVRAGGAYRQRLRHAGLYRVRWDGLSGPAVAVR